MALVIKDRVKQTSTTSGAGPLTLTGNVTGFQTFSVIGNGNSTYYCIADQNGPNWEVGIGIWNNNGTLSRNTILANSVGTTAPINFTSAVKDVFCAYPAEKAMLGDISAVTSTGTGDVVLSNSPTLSGNVSANVNLRSGTINTLLPLAGGSSEIGYATDANVLVRFNGTAGGAKLLGSYSNGATLNVNITTDAQAIAIDNGTTIIDCTNVSYLNITTGPNVTHSIRGLSIKLPAILSNAPVTTLTVSLPYGIGAGFLYPLYINIFFQQSDLDAALGTVNDQGYQPTLPDIYSATAGTIGTAGAPAAIGSNVLNITAGAVTPIRGQTLIFSDGTNTYDPGTYVIGVVSTTQILLSSPAKIASTGLTITGTIVTVNVARIYTPLNNAQYASSSVFQFCSTNNYLWTRTTFPWEGALLGGPLTSSAYNKGMIGEQIAGLQLSPIDRSLTSGTIANCGSLVLSQGVWMVYGKVIFTLSSGVSASSLSAGMLLGATGTSPLLAGSVVTTQITSAAGTTLTYAIPMQMVNVTAGASTTYQNAVATFSGGTISATIVATANRFG
jgi:hypothetical protein